MRNTSAFILSILLSVNVAFAAGSTIHNVESFGAVGDGKTMNTKAIQSAIDECAKQGGQVYFPKGTFLTATIQLKSNVVIYLDAQAILLGSPELSDYAKDKKTGKRALIHGYKIDNVSILGTGVIDGNGAHKNFWHKDVKNGIQGGVRPFAFAVRECSNFHLKEFTLKNGAFWNIELDQCDHVTVDDIRILSRIVANNDGVDVVDCKNVKISNSYFDVGDDGICLKSHSKVGVKNVTVTNCIIKSESNCIKFGTAGIGGFEDITVSNCVFYDTRLSGIAIEMVDGGIIDRVTMSNITMHNVNGSIFVKLGSRNKAKMHTLNSGDDVKGANTGILRNVIFSDIIADGIGCWKEDSTASYFKAKHDPRIGLNIVGQPGFPVENVTFNNIYLQFAGGGTAKDARLELRDKSPAGYPEYTNTGITPAYGINCLHVKGIHFNNVKTSYIDEDVRPAFCFNNVENVHINALQVQTSDKASSAIRFTNAENVFITNCKPAPAPIPFASFEENVKDVTIMGNDFRKVKSIYTLGKEVSESEIKSLNNLK